MDGLPQYRDLGAALAAGLLIGVERGWSARGEEAGTRVAGLRTFGLLGGLGGLIGLLARPYGQWMAIVLTAAVVAMLVYANARAIVGPDDVSATMFVAAIIALALGLLAVSGYPALALACSAITTLLLALRSELHGLLAKLGERDVKALARFAIITAAILPFLPNENFGPYGAWNPYTLWLVVVLVTGISFLGYAANRVFGVEHGTLTAAVIGGLYSSTAVTAALATRLRAGGSDATLLRAGIVLATTIGLVRALLLTGLLAGFAFLPLLSIVGPAALIAALTGAFLLRKAEAHPADDSLASANPIALLPALGFALLVAVMAVVSRWAQSEFGDQGVTGAILAVGLFDVDAAIVTLGGLDRGTISSVSAGLILAAALLANLVFKIGVAWSYAGRRKAGAALGGLGAAAACVALGIAVRMAFLE